MLFLAVGTIMIMAILTIVKNMLRKRQLEKYLEELKKEEEAKRRAEESSDEEPSEDKGEKTSCEKITEEEYDFQSRVLTK